MTYMLYDAVCESYKFSEKVQLDSIVYNELGSAKEIAIAAPKGEGGTCKLRCC